ncbi:MAG: hypothetical protein A3G33_08910 [Omnitrophica bacterium RIFCSPLOWO2_12_FULL_44_17]|uniref:Winged helix-turn-helix domain-containing protein n=1 Tax=Candidatus Danuiimicrobium aquiferis TaxID=1801832 RepID=A0A1G1L1B1_9BACT|nr:MAG: hypothetical protein A3B72_08250 [Omnitrophica bacterium RIFCSPHIGHO2_02_FULL_45_28]OGW88186.1 MAG: hypothetical protein A3E74_05890 [Omnitrophica bacterium RIFCSPHIGHO2_12_FULL_44_12]OGW98943.1 MAG: hypothetical protein A3G33_08910 [Omnitrophica bacterium RIFCSPLOWO2_12_FULL_44_17]OGX02036.1 MAG: hypothetical protein A3J12_03675 [Omnitrophica bacterium RIFCSPLOWO2_02_FULL_44_11]
MIMRIGITAGDIWHYLDKHQSATLEDLVKGTNKPRELILMSLGWLAREGHINLGDEATGYLSRLSQRNS